MRRSRLVLPFVLACGARTPLVAPDAGIPPPPACVPQDISTRYDATWLFGMGCRADWNSKDEVNFSSTSIHFTGFEGTIAAADPTTGALFAASDGIDLYDGSGNKRNSKPLGADQSTSQAAAFLGRPSSGDFYIVTNSANDGVGKGLFVTTLGCGNVTPQGSPVSLDDTNDFTEALATVRHANGVDRWLLSSSPSGVAVIAVTASGFGKATFTPLGGVLTLTTAQRAFIVFARDRKTFAMTAENEGLVTGTFDNATGTVSNLAALAVPETSSLYSAAFSPDQTKLYVSEWQGKFWQYDLAAQNAVTQLGSATGAMRLAIDDKVYIAGEGLSTLRVIQNPNAIASALEVATLTLPSGCTSSFGFPGVGEL